MKRVCSKLSLHDYIITTGMYFFPVGFGSFRPLFLGSRRSFLLLQIWHCELEAFLSESSPWSRLRCWCTGAPTGPRAPRPSRTHADARNPAASSFTTATVWRCSTRRCVRKTSGTTFTTHCPRVSILSRTGVRTDAGISTDWRMFPFDPRTRRQW